MSAVAVVAAESVHRDGVIEQEVMEQVLNHLPFLSIYDLADRTCSRFDLVLLADVTSRGLDHRAQTLARVLAFGATQAAGQHPGPRKDEHEVTVTLVSESGLDATAQSRRRLSRAWPGDQRIAPRTAGPRDDAGGPEFADGAAPRAARATRPAGADQAGERLAEPPSMVLDKPPGRRGDRNEEELGSHRELAGRAGIRRGLMSA